MARTTLWVCKVAAALLCCVSVNAQTQYTYILFSAPPSFGGIQAERINQYDNVVGTVIDNSGGEWGLIRYSDGGRKALMAPGATDTNFYDRNNAGTVVGRWKDAAHTHGLVFTQGSFQTVDYPGAQDTTLSSINNSNVILGGYSDATAGHSFLLSSGQYTAVGCPNLSGAASPGYIDSRGVMVGVYYGSNFAVAQGLVVRNGTCQLLSHPKGVNGTQLRAINASDVIVGWYLDAGNMPHAFRYSGGTFEDLRVPQAVSSHAEGINVGGEISGSAAMADNTTVGFIATPASSGCTATVPRTVLICSPHNSSTVHSPVHVLANADRGSSAVQRMEVWVDGKKKWQVFNSSTLDVTLSIDKGSRRVTVQAVDSAGTFKSTAYVTVN